jgi:glycerol-3-phosphate O-acyltransferase
MNYTESPKPLEKKKEWLSEPSLDTAPNEETAAMHAEQEAEGVEGAEVAQERPLGDPEEGRLLLQQRGGKLSPPTQDIAQAIRPLEPLPNGTEEEIDEITRKRLIQSAWTGMQERLRGFWGWFARRYAVEITLPPEREEQLKEAANQGTIVYVMRSQSYVNYFIYNALFLRYRLPLARFAQHLYWVPWAPFWRNVWIFFAGWIGRIFGSGGKDQAEIFRGLVKHQEATSFFLARPKTLLTHLRAGFYGARDRLRKLFGRPPAPGGRDISLLEEIVALQRQQKRPIFLCPQILVWDRTPSRTTRSLGDVLFGEKEFPGTLRELYLFFRDRRQSQVRGGAPINVLELIQMHPNWDDLQLAGYLQDRLTRRFEREYRIVNGPRQRPTEELKAMVLKAERLQKVIHAVAQAEGRKPEEIQRRAQKYLDRMASDLWMGVARFLDWLLNKIWRQMYSGIVIDRQGIERLREAALKGPIVLLPSHKSHVDYLIMSQVFYRYDLMLPNIAAGDNLLIPVVGWIFRHSGAFFIRRSFGDDEIYKAVFSEYVSFLLREGNNIEFFIEGGRSRTGKLRQPKLGVLAIIVDSVLERKVPDAYLAPTSIGYDKIIEGEGYSNELLGASKSKESIGGLLRARKLLKLNFGHVNIHFATPISLRRYIQDEIQQERKKKPDFDPHNNREDRKHLVRTLAYRIVYDINMASVATPTSLVATALMTHERRGLHRDELIEQVDWLRQRIVERGGRLNPFEDTAKIVDEAVLFLQKLLKRPKGLLEIVIRPRESRRIELSYYRNQLMHLFLSEAVVALAMQIRPSLRASDPGIPKDLLLSHVRRVSHLLKLEFVYRPTADIQENFEDTLALMIKRGILQEREGMILAAPEGAKMLGFLRALFAPFVDSYWVAALSLFSLEVGKPQEEKAQIKRMQEIAETLYHEGYLRYSDSVSMETLSNALELFREQGMITQGSADPKSGSKRRIKTLQLAEEAPTSLREFVLRIGAYSSCHYRADDVALRLERRLKDLS